MASLAEALTSVARRLQGRSTAVREFIALTHRARQIATLAWDVRTSRWAFQEKTAKLADALAAFAEEARAAADRATALAAGDAGVIGAVLAHAERIGRLQGEQPGSERQRAIQAELKPLEHTLASLQLQIGEERRISEDAGALAKGAAALAGHALELRSGGRTAEHVAHQIHTALTAFADEAATVSRRIAQSSHGINDRPTRIGIHDAQTRPIEAPGAGLVWHRIGTG